MNHCQQPYSLAPAVTHALLTLPCEMSLQGSIGGDGETSGLDQLDDWCAALLAYCLGVT